MRIVWGYVGWAAIWGVVTLVLVHEDCGHVPLVTAFFWGACTTRALEAKGGG